MSPQPGQDARCLQSKARCPPPWVGCPPAGHIDPPRAGCMAPHPARALGGAPRHRGRSPLLKQGTQCPPGLQQRGRKELGDDFSGEQGSGGALWAPTGRGVVRTRVLPSHRARGRISAPQARGMGQEGRARSGASPGVPWHRVPPLSHPFGIFSPSWDLASSPTETPGASAPGERSVPGSVPPSSVPPSSVFPSQQMPRCIRRAQHGGTICLKELWQLTPASRDRSEPFPG